MLLVFSISSLLAACTPSGQQAEISEQTITEQKYVATKNIPSDAEILKSKHAQALESGVASEQQLAVLASGKVTWEDYENAKNLTIQCIEEAGLNVSEPYTEESDGTTRILYTFTQGTSTLTDNQIEEHERLCMEKHSKFLESYWALYTPEAWAFRDRRAQALWEPFAECLTDSGVDVPKDASFDELTDLNTFAFAEGVEDCYSKIGAYDWTEPTEANQ